MPIQLDKILADIAEEKVLHPNYPDPNKKDVDDAWIRVGRNSKLSVHEARSIFKVLQKKYDQEKGKEKSAWKLFHIMDEIHKTHQKEDIKSDVREDDLALEEDEEYEMLEVQEDEDQTGVSNNAQQSGQTSFVSENESPSKSLKSNSSHTSPDKEEKYNKSGSQLEEKKLLNTMASATPRAAVTANSHAQVAAASLNKKGITVKKTTAITMARVPAKLTTTAISSLSSTTQGKGTQGVGFVKIVRPTEVPKTESTSTRTNAAVLETGKTILLPESIKRKLSEEQSSYQQSKKQALAQAARNSVQAVTVNTVSPQLVEIKEEADDSMKEEPGTAINIVTNSSSANGLINGITAGGGGGTSSTAATVASTSTNGFSPRIEEIDFRNDIIFDPGSGGAGVNNIVSGKNARSSIAGGEIINLGNFDNSLPPTFFKNLCNSSRHEALGLYVANVMNRLRQRSAAKLELGILRAIIDVQSDELEQ